MEDPDSALVYTDRIEDLIKMAREKRFSNEKIIKIITVGRFYADQKEVAKKFHEHLGISYGDFMRIARQR